MHAPRNQWYCAALSAELGPAPVGRIFLNEPVVAIARATAAPSRLRGSLLPPPRAVVEGRDRRRQSALRLSWAALRAGGGGFGRWARTKLPRRRAGEILSADQRKARLGMDLDGRRLCYADPETAPAFHCAGDGTTVGPVARLGCRRQTIRRWSTIFSTCRIFAFLHIKTIGAADDTSPNLTWERALNLLRGTRIARNLSPSQRQIAQGDTLRTDLTKIMTTFTCRLATS